MKRVVRKGVFETNSSSSHSLTIKKACKKSDKVEKGASFEIRSPFAKMMQILGLIDNADRDFNSTAYYIDEDHQNDGVKQAIIKTVNEASPDTLKGVDVDNITTYELSDLITPLIASYDVFTNEYFSKFDDGVLQVFYTVDCLCRGAVQRFKTKLIEALGKMNGWTMERTQQEIDFEAFSNVEIREILKDESTAKEKLIENMKYNYKFEREFKNSKSTDIVAFAKEYLIRDCKEFKKQVNGRISCELYFNNGCLNDCDCGLEDYYAIEKAFDINYYTPNEVLEQKAMDFLSDKYKIVAVENYCGFYLEQRGEIL